MKTRRIKRKKQIIAVTSVLMMLIIIIIVTTFLPKQKSSEEKREQLLAQLYSNIEDMEAQGKYKCCIEPPCTMCYLGDWIWDDGSCDCGGLILKGEFDKICPQCKKGIEKGLCKSTIKEDGCSIDLELA